MTIPGNLLTTAMAVMPHKNPNGEETVEKTFKVVNSLSARLRDKLRFG